MYPPQPALSRSHTGFCGPTNYKRECATGPSGAFKLTSLSACKAQCQLCDACNFISFSAKNRDCSWYETCNLSSLGGGGAEEAYGISAEAYLTFDMRDVRERLRRKLLAGSPTAPLLAPDFAFLDKACGPVAASMSAAACPEQIAWYANATWTLAQATSRRVIWGCETGFNCGHSSTTFLVQDPRIRMLSFDLLKWNFSRAARVTMQRTFGERFELVAGDSTRQIRAHFEESPPHRREAQRCDFLHIDGGHTYANALLDFAGFFDQSHCGALVLMDDVCDPTRCDTTDPWAVGPSRAWAELQRLGLVRETARGMQRVEGTSPRLWVAGRVLCREEPARRPPPVKLAPRLRTKGRSPPARAFKHKMQEDDDIAAGVHWNWPH